MKFTVNFTVTLGNKKRHALVMPFCYFLRAKLVMLFSEAKSDIAETFPQTTVSICKQRDAGALPLAIHL
jgi:hypothetical protein